MSEFLLFAIKVLASFRMSNMLPTERGPFEIFEKIRRETGIRANTGNMAWREIAYMVRCPYCQGFWMSLIISQLMLGKASISKRVLVFFAVYGGQTFLQKTSYPEDLDD